MKIISYLDNLDNDEIDKPDTTDVAVFTLETQRYTSKE